MKFENTETSMDNMNRDTKGSEKGFDLNGLCKTAHEYAKQRQENGGKISPETQSMLKHCATEVVEAMEALAEYRCMKDCGVKSDKSYFVSELSDIICCCMIIAAHENIDIKKAIEDCIEKNRKRAEGKGDKK